MLTSGDVVLVDLGVPTGHEAGFPRPAVVVTAQRAAHQYDDLDPRRVCRTVTRDLPALRAYLTDIVIPGLRP